MNQIERGVQKGITILSEIENELIRNGLIALFSIKKPIPSAHAESLVQYFSGMQVKDPYESARQLLSEAALDIKVVQTYCRAVNASHFEAGVRPINMQESLKTLNLLTKEVTVLELGPLLTSLLD